MTLTIASLLIASAAASAQPPQSIDREAHLARRASIGFAPTVTDGNVTIASVVPGSTAARMKLQPGDRIVTINTRPVNPQSLGEVLTTIAAHDRVSFRVIRAGKPLSLRGVADERPKEHYQGGRVIYSSVPIPGGRLRDIMVEPTDRTPDQPVIFLLQGITCASIEALDPNETYAQLASQAIKKGWSFYRVEKPGVGDSRGGTPCAERDFVGEIEAFRTAYDHLIDKRGIDPKRIIVIGHSMGGVQAPFVAADRQPGGIIVYGTVFRNWADYHLDAALWQPFLYSGKDRPSGKAAIDARKIVSAFFWQQMPPERIAASEGVTDDLVKELLGWNGKTLSFGRHYRFLQSMANVDQASAWSRIKVPVLSLYGGSDMVALTSNDHEMLAEWINFHAPKNGTFAGVPGADHDMRTVPDRAAFRTHVSATGTAPTGEFNTEVFSVISRWAETTAISKTQP